MKKSTLADKKTNIYLAGLGSISFGIGTIGPYGLFSQQNLKTVKKIGTNVKEKDLCGVQALTVFSTVESVDNAISKLKKLKKLMSKPVRKKKRK